MYVVSFSQIWLLFFLIMLCNYKVFFVFFFPEQKA